MTDRLVSDNTIHLRTLSTIKERFGEIGYVGPIPVFSPTDCRILLRRLTSCGPVRGWNKSHAAVHRPYYEAGTNRTIVDLVSELLGEEVMLWGASLVRREGGKVHPWHTDAETDGPAGRTVSVWIGLQNTTRQSSLQLVTRSHRFGIPVQERANQEGRARDELTNEAILAWAEELDAGSTAEMLEMTDGEAVAFDGALWHGSNNLSDRTRVALLLQYARPDTPIRQPVPGYLGWPFRYLEDPKPPCVVVRGGLRTDANEFVAPPAMNDTAPTQRRSWIRSLDLPLPGSDSGWQPYPIFRGSTPVLPALSCHASVLSAGHMPHEVHHHIEEEFLILLAGEAEIIIETPLTKNGKKNGPAPPTFARKLTPGMFSYYPAWQGHTIRNTGSGPATYLMFKWRGGRLWQRRRALETRWVDFRQVLAERGGDGWFGTARLLRGPSRYLDRLHSHVRVLPSGGGYEPHVDAYDVAIVTLEGTVETLGRRVGPNSVIFYAAGEPHGMKNVGEEPAVYLVFEFHGPIRRYDPLEIVQRPRKFLRRSVRRLRRAVAGAPNSAKVPSGV